MAVGGRGQKQGEVDATWLLLQGAPRAKLCPLRGASAAVMGQSSQERAQPGLQPLDSLETLVTVVFC